MNLFIIGGTSEVGKSIGTFLKPFSLNNINQFKLVQKGSMDIRKIILMFIKRKNWEIIGEGYKFMGNINLELSECGFFSVFEDLIKYEIRLSESDNLNDYNGSKKRGHILC